MSFPYDRYDRSSNRRSLFTGSSTRTTFGYWIPLAITLTAATAGLAAWVWNERSRDSEEEDEYVYEQEYESEYDEHLAEERREEWRKEHGETSIDGSGGAVTGGTAAEFHGGAQQDLPSNPSAAVEYGPPPNAPAASGQNEEGFMAQMRGAFGRTPSPQQLMTGARKGLSAGVAAVGRGLNSIREDGDDENNPDYFGDHERWSEEAESRERTENDRHDIGALGAAAAAGGALVGGAGASAQVGEMVSNKLHSSSTKARLRMVTVVVSAENPETNYGDTDEDLSHHVEHASILSHLIGHVNPDSAQLLILIYAPHIERHPLASQPVKEHEKSRRTSTGSYDKLSDNLQTQSEAEDPSPGPFRQQTLPITLEDQDAEDRIINSYTSSSNPTLYNALATQAATLVSHPTHILPFTSPSGHVHMLKHLAPSLVYMQESLCGERGQLVQEVEGWIGQCVVVVGAEGAGLVDTETEDEGGRKQEESGKRWWQDERRVGLGKGVEVVEGMHLGEDWVKRVEGG